MKRLALLVAAIALSTNPGSAAQVRALVAKSTSIRALTPTQVAALPNLLNQNASVLYGIPTQCLTADACVYGDVASSKVVVLFGDSHARMWMPAILPGVIADNDRLVVLGQNACAVVDINWTGGVFSPCNAARSEALSVIASLHPFATIVADYTGAARALGISAAQWETGMEATLAAIGGNRVLIGDITHLNDGPPQCLAANPTKVQRCSAPNPNPRAPGEHAAEQAAAKAEGVPYINPTSWLCAKRCSPVIGKYLAYWDSYHITTQYAAYLAKVMGEAIKPILGS